MASNWSLREEVWSLPFTFYEWVFYNSCLSWDYGKVPEFPYIYALCHEVSLISLQKIFQPPKLCKAEDDSFSSSEYMHSWLFNNCWQCQEILNYPYRNSLQFTLQKQIFENFEYTVFPTPPRFALDSEKTACSKPWFGLPSSNLNLWFVLFSSNQDYIKP